MRHILTTPAAGLYALLDPFPFLEDPVCQRFVREIAMGHARCARTLVLVGARIDLPPEIQRMSASFALALPTAADIRRIFKEEIELWIAQHDGRKPAGDPEAAETLVQRLVGMYQDDARRLIRQALRVDGRVTWDDVAVALKQKHHALESGGALALQTEIEKFTAVGGQEKLKRWIERRREVFVGDAARPGSTCRAASCCSACRAAARASRPRPSPAPGACRCCAWTSARCTTSSTAKPRRTCATALASAERDGALRAVDRRDREGPRRDGGDGDGGVSRRVLGYPADLDGRAQGAGVPGRHRQRRRRPAAGAAAQGPLRRDLLRRPAAARRCARRSSRCTSQAQARSRRASTWRRWPRRADGFSGAEIEQAIVAALYAAHARTGALDAARARRDPRHAAAVGGSAEQVEALRDWAAERTVPAD